MTKFRHLGEAQVAHTRVIDGVILMPWNWSTVEICEGRKLHPADDLAGDARVFGLLMIADDASGTAGRCLTTQDRRYEQLRRAYWASFGLEWPVSLHKSYVPWWAGKWSHDKLGNRIPKAA